MKSITIGIPKGDWRGRIKMDKEGIPLEKLAYRNIPQKWNDLTFKQYRKLSALLYSQPTAAELAIKLAYIFIALPKRLFFRIAPDQIRDQLGPLVLWCTNTPEAKYSKCLIPGFWFRGMYYKGPNNFLKNLSVSRMGYALTYLTLYQKTNDEKYLDKLIAVLYAFLFYREGAIESKAKHFSKMPPQLKFAILLNFSSMLNYMPVKYPKVYESHPVKEKSMLDWHKVVMGLTGDSPWTKNKIEKMKWVDILAWMEGKHEAAAAAKQKANS